MPRESSLQANLSDIQGNILRGYPAQVASYRAYHIPAHSKDQGRAWMHAILIDGVKRDANFCITTAESWVGPDDTVCRPPYTVNVAVSSAGLAALGLPPSVVKTFPEEFQEGMRSRAVSILGDTPGASTSTGEGDQRQTFVAPKHWDAAFQDNEIHVLIMMTAKTDSELQRGATVLQSIDSEYPQVTCLQITLQGEALTGALKGKEHFGYADGISQPFLEGVEDLYDDEKDKIGMCPGQGHPTEIKKGEAKGSWLPIKPGEFLLGYQDELGEVADAPIHDELRRNGTYLVLRKLEQDVPEFEKFLEEDSQGLWDQETIQEAGSAKELLAAKLMGRWRSGCPLELSHRKDDSKKDRLNPQINNNFRYVEDDPDGAKCPLGAHIRRTNPRDQLVSIPRDFSKREENRYHLNRHRMIRRGIPYGAPYAPEKDSSEKSSRGLIFVAMVGSIARQFEFVQQHWIHSGDFLGLDATDRDPLIGQCDDQRAKLTIPGAQPAFRTSLKSFVTERGGEYFFYPSLTALRRLAEGAFLPRDNFVRQFEELSHLHNTPNLSPPDRQEQDHERALAQQELLAGWLRYRPKELFEDLLAERPILQIPGFTIGHVTRRSLAIVTKFHHVKEILENEGQAFSVLPYAQKMGPPRGPFILGMEAKSEDYHREREILMQAVPRSEIATRIQPIIEKLVQEAMKPLKNKDRIDVISDLAWVIPIRFNRDYFGLSHDEEVVLKRWYRDLFKDIFLNLQEREDWTKEADRAALEINGHLDSLILKEATARKKSETKTSDQNETVLQRLIRFQEKEETRFDDTMMGVRRNLVGMVMGVVETTLKAVARTVEQLLRPERAEALGMARAAVAKHDDKTLERIVFEAMRFNPQNPMVVRMTTKEASFSLGSKKTVTIAPGTVVFAATLGAMFDPEKIPYPQEFNIHRDQDNYLLFGSDPDPQKAVHHCLGEYISRVQVTIILKHLLQLKDLRPAVETEFDPFDPLPKHYFLQFTGEKP